eukprot:GHVU01148805.1.p1 GENE.GHVU01148805.1~~GHVU01148805.1.p1  ORF type:complete len:343 (-),score=63.07 GHVU01148805.1:91-1119(-)
MVMFAVVLSNAYLHLEKAAPRSNRPPRLKQVPEEGAAGDGRLTPPVLSPELLHQCLMALLDAPLNKEGFLRVYILTSTGRLLRVSSTFRVPRTYRLFDKVFASFLASGNPNLVVEGADEPILETLPADASPFRDANTRYAVQLCNEAERVVSMRREVAAFRTKHGAYRGGDDGDGGETKEGRMMVFSVAAGGRRLPEEMVWMGNSGVAAAAAAAAGASKGGHVEEKKRPPTKVALVALSEYECSALAICGLLMHELEMGVECGGYDKEEEEGVAAGRNDRRGDDDKAASDSAGAAASDIPSAGRPSGSVSAAVAGDDDDDDGHREAAGDAPTDASPPAPSPK